MTQAKHGIDISKATIHGGDFSKLILGNGLYIGDAFLDLHDTITIEDRVGLGHQVKILTGTHNYLGFDTERATVISRPVAIRRGAWVASFSILLPGSEVGEYSVVGAGSVVHGKIEPYTFVAGNPAKVIKKLARTSQLDDIDSNPSSTI